MLTRLAQFVLIALAAMIGCPVSAAPLSYGTYYDETVGIVSCASIVSCHVRFSQLPSDKLVMVQKVNCLVTSSQPVTEAVLVVNTTFGGPSLPRNLPMAVPPSQLISGIYYTNWETTTHWLVGNGRFPNVLVNIGMTGSINASCTIIGDLVTPIQ